MASVEDNIREVEWRDLADTVLVFVCPDTLYNTCALTWFQDGLFAAFLSAFLVFLIPQLQPNSTDVAMDVLIHISQQLSNSTTPAFVPAPFQVSASAAVVNMLLFLSLALVLIDAFLAMLVKGWLQEFDRGWRKYTVAHLRAQERERRLQELERWKLHELVALLPILIQGSLLLFCIGLLVLISPLHLPSAILCSLAFVCAVGFYCFTTYVSIVNSYAPFSSPFSRILAHVMANLQTWSIPITRNIRRIASAIRFHSRPLLSQEQRADANASLDATPPSPSSNRVAKPIQPHKPDGVEKSEVVPRFRSNIDPQTHIHVLERLVSTTAEAVENIPIFLELLDQPVKDATLRPFNVEKWKELLHITLGLLADQSTFPVSAAWTLARTMMICYNRETADQQLCLTLHHHLGSRETDEKKSRMPLKNLFSSYLRFWLGYSHRHDMWRAIAFLEPSDAADAELLWMVNTFHRTVQSEDLVHDYLGFFVAVLTYVSSTEQSRRSQVPLTAAVVYAMHTIRSALDQGGINSIDGLCILSRNVSTSESVPMAFHQNVGIDALDLWSVGCTQLVKNLLERHCHGYECDSFQLSLIAALYIDSTKQAHAHSIFADLVKDINITNTTLQWSDAYDHKLAIYWYMAVSRQPLNRDHYPLAALYKVIEKTIMDYPKLPLSGLHILEIAVNYVCNTTSPPSNWLKKWPFGLILTAPDEQFGTHLVGVDHWVLLHLDTLLAPQSYLLPEEVKELKWSDTPANVHVAQARLDLYDSMAKAKHEGTKVPRPDPELLRVFLWSKDHEVCIRAFRWCLDLVPSIHLGTPGDGDSTRMFIPETMGYAWIEHFIHVICKGRYRERIKSREFLISHLVPKWSMLPSSWCRDFSSTILFSLVHPLGMQELPAYQCLAEPIEFMRLEELRAFLPFLATMLELIKPSLTWSRLASFENWLAEPSEDILNHSTQTQMEHILATMKHQLAEETLGFFAELPMVDSWMRDDLQWH